MGRGTSDFRNSVKMNVQTLLAVILIATSSFGQASVAVGNAVSVSSGVPPAAIETSSTVTLGQERVWRMTGPFGGDVASMAIDPRNSHRLIAGTNDGQLFRSGDDGVTWQRLKPGLGLSGYAVRSIHFDFSNPQRIYIAMNQIMDAVDDSTGGAFFISENSGDTWREAQSIHGRSIRGVVQSFSSPNILLAAARDGIYRSKDSGENWTKITPDNDPELKNFHSVAVDPRDPGRIFAGTTHLPWKTSDGGLTWTRAGSKESGMIDDSDIFCIQIDGSNPETMFMSACSGIYKSIDGSTKWTKIQGIPFTSRRTHVIFQHPTRPNVVFAGTTEGLWRTTDGGQTWSLSAMSPKTQVVNAVVIHPEQPDRVYIGTEDNGILISTDGGEAFEPSNLGFINRQIRVVSYDRTERGRLYAGVIFDGSNGGLFVSQDGGTTWQQSTRGMGTSDVYSIYQPAEQPEKIYVGTNHGLYRSDNRGESWKKVGKAQVREAEPSAAKGPRNIVQQRPSARRTAPKAPAAKVPAEPKGPELIDLQKQVFSIAPLYPRGPEEKPGMITATWDGLFVTRDEEKGWQKAKTEINNHAYFNVVVTSAAVPGVVLAGVEDGLLISRDNGENFEKVLLGGKPHRVQAVVFDPREPANIYVGTNYGFFISHDGGQSWYEPGNGLRTAVATTAVLVNPGNPEEIYVGDQRWGGLFHSENRGKSWEMIETSRLPSYRLWSMSADPFDASTISFGSFSGGVYVMKKQPSTRLRKSE